MTVATRIEEIYNYLRHVGVNGNEAKYLITEDLRLVEKNSCFIRAIHWCVAKLGLSDPIKEPTYLPSVINNISAVIKDEKALDELTLTHANFIKQTLLNIRCHKDRHLAHLKALNQEPSDAAYQRYATGDLPRPDSTSWWAKITNYFWPKPPVSPSPIATLPTELLKEIVSYLCPKELARTRIVCKKWKQAGEDPAVWRQLHNQVRLFDRASSFPHTIQMQAKVVRNLTAHLHCTRDTGVRIQDPAIWQLVGSYHGSYCLQSENAHIIQKGAVTTTIEGPANAFRCVKGELYLLSQTELRRWNLSTLTQESFSLNLPELPIRAYAIENQWVNICCGNSLYRYNMNQKHLESLGATEIQDSCMQEHYCLSKQRVGGNILYHDLYHPEKGVMQIPHGGSFQTLHVKNGIAVLRCGAFISLYDLKTRKLFCQYLDLLHTNMQKIYVEEGMLYYISPQNRLAARDLVTDTWLGHFFTFPNSHSIHIDTRTVTVLTLSGEIHEANLLLPERPRFSLLSLRPSDDTMETVGIVATVVAGIAALLGLAGGIYYAAERERTGRGNLFTRAVVIGGEAALIALYAVLQIMELFENSNRHRRHA